MSSTIYIALLGFFILLKNFSKLYLFIYLFIHLFIFIIIIIIIILVAKLLLWFIIMRINLYLSSITRSYKTNLHQTSVKHGILKWQNTIKVNVMNQILNYVGYTKPMLAIYVLHNLDGQLSQNNDFIFSLNIDRDKASLISVGTKLLYWGVR